MPDLTRQHLNQIKRNIQESDVYIVIAYSNSKASFKVSSNLNDVGQIKLITDAGEQIRKRALRYLQPRKEDEQSERPLDAGSGSSEEG